MPKLASRQRFFMFSMILVMAEGIFLIGVFEECLLILHNFPFYEDVSQFSVVLLSQINYISEKAIRIQAKWGIFLILYVTSINGKKALKIAKFATVHVQNQFGRSFVSYYSITVLLIVTYNSPFYYFFSKTLFIGEIIFGN